MTASLFFVRSDRDPINRDPCVRMCYNWYTRIDIIRTLRGNIRQREALVSFLVIDHDIQMIIEDINSIDERLNDVAAEERIGAIAFCELM